MQQSERPGLLVALYDWASRIHFGWTVVIPAALGLSGSAGLIGTDWQTAFLAALLVGGLCAIVATLILAPTLLAKPPQPEPPTSIYSDRAALGLPPLHASVQPPVRDVRSDAYLPPLDNKRDSGGTYDERMAKKARYYGQGRTAPTRASDHGTSKASDVLVDLAGDAQARASIAVERMNKEYQIDAFETWRKAARGQIADKVGNAKAVKFQSEVQKFADNQPKADPANLNTVTKIELHSAVVAKERWMAAADILISLSEGKL